VIQGELADAAEKKAAEQVYHQRPAGEAGTGAILDRALKAISGKSSGNPKNNEEEYLQTRSTFCCNRAQ